MLFKYCDEGHLMDPSWKRCPVCLAPLSGWLVQLKENKAVKVYTIHEGKSFIGSGADCEIRVLAANMSRQQAYLVIADGICSIVDMGNSGMPLKINNIDSVKAALIDGDVIQMGDNIFKIKLL
jgi:hypothetical protein